MGSGVLIKSHFHQHQGGYGATGAWENVSLFHSLAGFNMPRPCLSTILAKSIPTGFEELLFGSHYSLCLHVHES